MDTPSSPHLSSTGHRSLPQTPQPPFSPPKRHSSLAFASSSRKATCPISTGEHCGSVQSPQAETAQLGTTSKRFTISPSTRDSPSQLQRIFQAARGALHRDVFTASSPAGSIESRMKLDEASPLYVQDGSTSETREWRYSTAPQILATVSSDVREPLLSPTLPNVLVGNEDLVGDSAEPISSGFGSPVARQPSDDVHGAATSPHSVHGTKIEVEDGLDQTQSAKIQEADDSIELNWSLHHLRVDDAGCDIGPHTESPRVQHYRTESGLDFIASNTESSPHNRIYLSESAEAAANSAKAKRRWLKGIFNEAQDEKKGTDGHNGDPDDLPDLRMICPDPTIHRVNSITPCPDPSIHRESPLRLGRPPSAYELDMLAPSSGDGQASYTPMVAGSHRATATGSPMPFTRFRSRCSTTHSDRRSLRISPRLHQQEATITTMNEHFQPGWYYSRETRRSSPRTAYSFSTAASKLIGSDQAPDSRMRDSYKTDTLTALPAPTSRYRKNGIAADIPPRGLNRYYQGPPSSMRTHGSRARTDSRQTYTSGSEVRFRSSPPRASGNDQFPPLRRKRAVDDSFMVSENVYAGSGIDPEMRLHPSDDMMQVDEQTKAAVRMSIFGSSTPEALRHARQGIKELSPNVQLYRKGAQENEHLRKKRRPSYWDNDLREIRESPAGRGGVRSPVSAQESMRAEFEVASQRDTEMVLDERC